MRAVGLILAGGNSRKMRELTAKRAVAATHERIARGSVL